MISTITQKKASENILKLRICAPTLRCKIGKLHTFSDEVHLLDTQSVWSSRHVWPRVVGLEEELIRRIQTLKYVDNVFDFGPTKSSVVQYPSRLAPYSNVRNSGDSVKSSFFTEYLRRRYSLTCLSLSSVSTMPKPNSTSVVKADIMIRLPSIFGRIFCLPFTLKACFDKVI